ncbi:MAG TPA: GTP cyclohydrolase I FolE [Saprospiraceae bacterium]|nr:GTP cyclohydrolase I FolE [Saprospiraceae bacterium]
MKVDHTLMNSFLAKNITDKKADDYCATSIESPIRSDAFNLPDEEKIKHITYHFKKIMHTLGLDLNDDSLKNTPGRVAKMYVKEVFAGLNPTNKPDITLFNNKYQYNEMLIEKNITLYSYCEHHFVPIIGKVHVAYYSKGYVIGLSKLNRLVQYYANRPQVQERLTIQIAEAIKEAVQSEDIAVVIDAEHLCVSSRGIKDTNTSTITSNYSGRFRNEKSKLEFLTLINSSR